MIASSTQETLLNDDDQTSNNMFLRSISTLDANDFKSFIQEQYGACWGMFKFEDSLSDYSNDVSFHSEENSFCFLIRMIFSGSTISLC